MNIEYLHIKPNSEMPDGVFGTSYAVVVIVELEVTEDWRAQVSRWLVDSGCLYMMAWGKECLLWHHSVDYAHLDDWDNGEIPASRFVMTTWHENEPLEDVFWYAQNAATHQYLLTGNLLILDIVPNDRGDFILAKLAKSKLSILMKFNLICLKIKYRSSDVSLL